MQSIVFNWNCNRSIYKGCTDSLWSWSVSHVYLCVLIVTHQCETTQHMLCTLCFLRWLLSFHHGRFSWIMGSPCHMGLWTPMFRYGFIIGCSRWSHVHCTCICSQRHLVFLTNVGRGLCIQYYYWHTVSLANVKHWTYRTLSGILPHHLSMTRRIQKHRLDAMLVMCPFEVDVLDSHRMRQ